MPLVLSLANPYLAGGFGGLISQTFLVLHAPHFLAWNWPFGKQVNLNSGPSSVTKSSEHVNTAFSWNSMASVEFKVKPLSSGGLGNSSKEQPLALAGMKVMTLVRTNFQFVFGQWSIIFRSNWKSQKSFAPKDLALRHLTKRNDESWQKNTN